MTFSNVQVCLRELPGLDGLTFEPLHRRHARVVLALALAWSAATLAATAAALFVALVPSGRVSTATAWVICGSLLGGLALVVWFAHKSASVIGFALREHDVTVRSGVFWRRETVQPIRRIQHVEQHQGPLDRRYGLHTLKLFSAGTGHFTFRIPGLDADTAARIRRHVTGMAGSGAEESRPGGRSHEVVGAGAEESRPGGRSHEVVGAGAEESRPGGRSHGAVGSDD